MTAAEGGWAKPALARRDPLLRAVHTTRCFERIMAGVERLLDAERARAPRPPDFARQDERPGMLSAMRLLRGVVQWRPNRISTMGTMASGMPTPDDECN